MLIIDELYNEFPNLKIKTKAEATGLIKVAFHIIGKINKKFWTHYTTTIGETIYVPSKIWLAGKHAPATLRHERVHLRDARKWKLFYTISYLLVLPAGLTLRSMWEMRAYKESMRAWYETRSKITDKDIDFLVSAFCGPDYFYMSIGRARMRKKLLKIRDEIIEHASF